MPNKLKNANLKSAEKPFLCTSCSVVSYSVVVWHKIHFQLLCFDEIHRWGGPLNNIVHSGLKIEKIVQWLPIWLSQWQNPMQLTVRLPRQVALFFGFCCTVEIYIRVRLSLIIRLLFPALQLYLNFWHWQK